MYSSYGDYASSFLPDNSQPLSTQIYDEETGQTWEDMFDNLAIESMTKVAATYAEGKKAGYTLTEEQQQELQEELDSVKTNAETYGYSVDEYLRTSFGASMNDKTYTKLAERIHYADSYDQSVREGYKYSDEELSEYYSDNADRFDTFTYRYFYIGPEEYDSEDESAEAAAVAEAQAKAEEYAADIKTEQDFIDAARDYDPDSYGEDESTLRHYQGELLGSIYGDWMKSADRKYGDVTTSTTENNGTYVVFYMDRSANDYPTVNAYMIQLDAEAVSEDDYEDDAEGYEAAQQAALDDLKTRAEDLFSQWKSDSDHSAENFVEYVNKNSDTVTYEDGYAENIYRYAYEDDMDAWLFDSSRKEGDVELFPSSDGSSYFLVYFEGTDMDYCDYLADNELRTNAYNEWIDALTADAKVKKTWLFSLAK